MQAAEADTRNMKPLVALVIIMGVLIVAGIVVVIATIANRMGGGGREATSTRGGAGVRRGRTCPCPPAVR